jgi:hypothetical protein
MPPEKNMEQRLRELGRDVGEDDSLAKAIMARIRTGQGAASDKCEGRSKSAAGGGAE